MTLNIKIKENGKTTEVTFNLRSIKTIQKTILRGQITIHKIFNSRNY